MKPINEAAMTSRTMKVVDEKTGQREAYLSVLAGDTIGRLEADGYILVGEIPVDQPIVVKVQLPIAIVVDESGTPKARTLEVSAQNPILIYGSRRRFELYLGPEMGAPFVALLCGEAKAFYRICYTKSGKIEVLECVPNMPW